MNWMCIKLSSSDVAAGRLGEIQESFASLWIAAGAPPEATMYAAKSARDNVCFFNPAAAKLAGSYLSAAGAVDCAAPDLEELAVLVKNEGAPLPSKRSS